MGLSNNSGYNTTNNIIDITYRYDIYIYTGWWLTYPSEKYESQLSVGMIIPNIWKK
jgi:hypothetical protein